MKDKNKKGNGKKGGPPVKGFVPEYRNKWTGRIMRASDYGYKAWPFGGGRKGKAG